MVKLHIGYSAASSMTCLLGALVREAAVEIVEVPTIELRVRPEPPDATGVMRAPRERAYGPPKKTRKGKVRKW